LREYRQYCCNVGDDTPVNHEGPNMGSADKVSFPDPKERTPTILIVEDEALIRAVLSEFLQECGFKVSEAGHAAEAIEIVQQPVVQIDLVFSDMRMPSEIDGFGLSRWIRENCPSLPVILASGDVGKANIAHELCANEPFLIKPYDLPKLRA
jgi:CheY-like chemotaxis protein